MRRRSRRGRGRSATRAIRRTDTAGHRRLLEPAAWILGGLALAAWATWPLVTHLATHVYDPAAHGGALAAPLCADVYLTHWITAWSLHALETHPARLYDAPIFHPAGGTLTLTEHMIGALPLYAPVAWIGGDPVLAHQTTLLLSFAAAFIAAATVVRAWTASAPAAVVAGCLFVLTPFRLGHLADLQMQGDWYLPFLVYAAWRSTRDGGRWMPLLATVLTLQTLHCYYLGYAAFVTVGVVASVLVLGGSAVRRRCARLVVPTVVAAGIVAVVSLPYVEAYRRGALPSASAVVLSRTSAALGDTGSPMALALAMVTAPFWRRGLRRDVPVVWCVALAAVAIVAHALALGPEIHLGEHRVPGPYAALRALAPGFAMVRLPFRLNAAAAAALAILAGIGLAGALRRTWLHMSAAALVLLAWRLVLPHGLPLRPIETGSSLPAAYADLAHRAPGPLLEVPFHDFNTELEGRVIEARRTYLAIYHGHPLLNGYAGYTPPSYAAVSALARAAPDADAFRRLARDTGVRWILVHRDEMTAAARRRWRERPGWVRPVARYGADVLFGIGRQAQDTNAGSAARGGGAGPLSPLSGMGTPVRVPDTSPMAPPVPPLLLIVDDDRDSRSALAALLKLDGYLPVQARSARHGLRFLELGLQPCCILLNFAAPAEAWRFRTAQLAKREWKAIPVVVAGELGPPPRGTSRAADVPVAACLRRPFALAELFAAIDRYCAVPPLRSTA
jgi:CheY-like chemotaxis protein